MSPTPPTWIGSGGCKHRQWVVPDRLPEQQRRDTMAYATALLDRTEANAQRLLTVGLIAFLVGALLLVGLSSSPLWVVVGGAVVLGGPLVIFLKGGEQTVKQALPLTWR